MRKSNGIAVATAALVALLVLGFVGIGGLFISRAVWSGPVLAQGPTTDSGAWGPMGGMMGRNFAYPGTEDGAGWAPCWGYADDSALPSESEVAISDVPELVESYLTRSGYRGLEVDEVMEFELNFYAIVIEEDTGIGAMELLIDKQTGIVGPEYGPNMMWNTRYGMHGGRGMSGMMWDYRSAEDATISPDEALDYAQRWLNAYRPGMTTEEHADPFYGYYTIHTLRDGVVAGMLSVHGTTGQVWYHSWHGGFIAMIEEDHE